MVDVWNGDGANPLSPRPPEALHFDPAQGFWVLSRYADVLAGLREPLLCQARPIDEARTPIRDEAAQMRIRTEVLATLSQSKLAEWRVQMERLADSIINSLPVDRTVDLVQEVIQPWSVAVTASVNGADPLDTKHLIHLARQMSVNGSAPRDSVLLSRAATAKARFEHAFESGAMPLGKSMFLGLCQTLPDFLAKAWLALLRHPYEMRRLHAEPELMPRAIEELLRYAGLVHTLFRRASGNFKLGAAKIREGEGVILKLASANRDPVQFTDPDRLDLTRRGAGQLALGAGPHSCVGALLVRMGVAAATRAWIERFPLADLAGPVTWRGDATLCSPASLPVKLKPPDQTCERAKLHFVGVSHTH